jgi:hypothetical protein
MKQGTTESADTATPSRQTFSLVRHLDRLRLWFALQVFWWARRTIGRVRARRGRDFIGCEADIIDRHRVIYTELDQAEERKRSAAYRF